MLGLQNKKMTDLSKAKNITMRSYASLYKDKFENRMCRPCITYYLFTRH